MNRIAEVLEELSQKAEAMQKNSSESDLALSSQYECIKCKDTELIITVNDEGYEVARDCECRQVKIMRRRFKNALIPDEFKDARFDNYKQENEIQRVMFEGIKDYLKNFETNRKSTRNSFGFMAAFGEQRIKELDYKERSKVKKKHNNFGLGKTHLQAAAAKWLIKHGYSTLMVSDVVFMDDLIQAKMARDNGEQLNRLLSSAIKTDVLVWDDIGKSKWSEAKESLYYQVINERYRNHSPILFSSNEDDETLADKIGYAAASRLFGMSKHHLFAVEGADYRTEGEE